jgi:LPXTG-motif cell wall-anchored protein
MRIISLFVIIVFVLTPLKTYAENNIPSIDLTTNPDKVLFDLSNVKPGDSVTRELIIKNNGTDDFNYLASNSFISGSNLFFRKLDLKIEENSTVLYDGKLSNFTKLGPRSLKSNQNKKLKIYIQVPPNLGNEYQGLEMEFQFKFYVEGTLGGILPATGPKLPVTGTNTFNYLVAGAVLFLGGLLLQFLINRKKLYSKV